MSLACHFTGCNEATGHSLLCDFHRRNLTDGLRRKYRNIWHDIIIERGREYEMYRCFHCENLFTREYMIGDHFPYTVGRRKDLEFDIRNGVPSCTFCNTDPSKRKDPKEYLHIFADEQIPLTV